MLTLGLEDDCPVGGLLLGESSEVSRFGNIFVSGVGKFDIQCVLYLIQIQKLK